MFIAVRAMTPTSKKTYLVCALLQGSIHLLVSAVTRATDENDLHHLQQRPIFTKSATSATPPKQLTAAE